MLMPPAYENLRERQMSKKRLFASALDSLGEGGAPALHSLGEGGGLPRPLDIRSVVPTAIL